MGEERKNRFLHRLKRLTDYVTMSLFRQGTAGLT